MISFVVSYLLTNSPNILHHDIMHDIVNDIIVLGWVRCAGLLIFLCPVLELISIVLYHIVAAFTKRGIWILQTYLKLVHDILSQFMISYIDFYQVVLLG